MLKKILRNKVICKNKIVEKITEIMLNIKSTILHK